MQSTLLPLDWADAVELDPELDVARRPASTPEPEVELWYKDNETGGTWAPIDSRREAEDLLRTRNEDSPWVTILRTVYDAQTDDSEWRTMEILAHEGTCFIGGDVRRERDAWFWSSWPAGWQNMPRITARCGPSWYQGIVYGLQLMAISDAVTQLWPALHAQFGVENQVPGYVWRNRAFDYHDLVPLRSPIVRT